MKGRQSHRVRPFRKKRQLISDPGISPKTCWSLPELSPMLSTEWSRKKIFGLWEGKTDKSSRDLCDGTLIPP